MENFFNIDRFRLLIRKHAFENKTLFLFSILIMEIPVALALISNSFNPLNAYPTYCVFLWLIGGFYTGIYFNNWREKERAAHILLLPATAFEKIAQVLFFTIIVFIPIYSAIFWGSFELIFKIVHPNSSISFIHEYKHLSPFDGFLVYGFTLYLFFQSFTLLCSVWFKKRQTWIALRTLAGVFIGSYAFLSYYFKSLIKPFFLGSADQLLFFPTSLNDPWEREILRITSPMVFNLTLLVICTTTLLFYIASYLKLKEKEI